MDSIYISSIDKNIYITFSDPINNKVKKIHTGYRTGHPEDIEKDNSLKVIIFKKSIWQ